MTAVHPQDTDVSKEEVMITTKDGDCPCFVLTPAHAEKSPAVIFYMDAGGIRPAIVKMAERLAGAGFVVLLPDLFYRFGPYGPLVPAEVFQGDVMAILGPLMASTDNARAAADTEAFLVYLKTRSDIVGRFGAVGFCMGGGMALTAGATFSDRFGAVSSFHGGNLASEDPMSPHRMVSGLKSEVYIAAADHDDFYPPAMAEKLEDALKSAGVRYRSETYVGAAHGWMMPDFPVFNETAAERGWNEMTTFFDRALRGLPSSC
jgi:carboxymethylenebutenolidase